MHRHAFTLLLAAAVLATLLAVWQVARPVSAVRPAPPDPQRLRSVTDQPALRERGPSGKDEGGARPPPVRPAPNVDESPWPETSGAGPAEGSSPVCGKPGLRGDAENLPDLERVRQAFRAMDGSSERRDAFRRMMAGDEAGLAGALAMYWSSAPDEPWVRDFLAVVRTSAPPFLAGWLADAAEGAAVPDARERFRELLGQLQGPAAAASMVSVAMETSDPALRGDMLVFLGARRAASETRVLAEASLVADAEVAAAAARGLAAIGGSRAYASLAATAADLGRADMVLEALGSACSPFGHDGLMAMATDSSQSAALRTAAIRSLVHSGSERVLVALENTVCASTEPLVVAVAQTAIQDLREQTAIGCATMDSGGLVCADERWF